MSLQDLPDELMLIVLEFLAPVTQVTMIVFKHRQHHLMEELASSRGVTSSAAVSDFIFHNQPELGFDNPNPWSESHASGFIRFKADLGTDVIRYRPGTRPASRLRDLSVFRLLRVLREYYDNRNRCLWKYLPAFFRNDYDTYFRDLEFDINRLPSVVQEGSVKSMDVIEWSNQLNGYPLRSNEEMPAPGRLSPLVSVITEGNELRFYDFGRRQA